jgi:hypothetical protein
VEEANESGLASTSSKSKTWQTTVQRVPSWPEEARALKKRTGLAYVYAIGDLILILLPIYFLRKSS